MPVVDISLVPEDPRLDLEDIARYFKEDISRRIPELELTPDQVTVTFPADLRTKGLGKEIIIKVYGLFYKPKRSKEVVERLAKTICYTARSFLIQPNIPQCNLIEVFVETFGEKRICAFAKWTRDGSDITTQSFES